MKEYKKYGLVAALVVIVLLAGAFYAGFAYGKSKIPSQFLIEGVINKSIGQPGEVDFSLFWDTWRVIQERYVGRADLDKQDLVFGAISGMIRALGDPYTVFLKPEEAKIFREDVAGSFGGIGAEIGIRNDVLTVIAPLEGSPAKRQGLAAGDKIIKINNETTENINLNEAVQKIRGPDGTAVTLTVIRNDETKEISIVRETIKIPVLDWARKEGDVVHLKLFSFSQEAPRRFAEAMVAIVGQPVDGVVLDLRNNPGGFLEVAQEIMGWFVTPGEVIAIEDFGDGQGRREYRAVGNGLLRDKKVVVLINEGSASASEIVAGALRDLRGVKVVGAKSFGKGSIQELESLRGGASIKVTVARWLTPSGVSISQEGLNPDVAVEPPKDDESEERDPQLEKALELIR